MEQKEQEIKQVDLDKLLQDVRVNLLKDIKEENLKLLADAFSQFKNTSITKVEEDKKEESTKKELMDF